MDGSFENTLDESKPGPPQLSKGQRRILGVLVEKALTTPDQYPLTLKAVTTGANQKSNRDPVTNYSEGAVWDILDELKELGLAAVVNTESGRTERFRHYVRKRYPFNETQLAIMTELWLRGPQQLGELRARASRMVPIESLEDLRAALNQLLEQNFVRSNGNLERRGIQVDHKMHAAGEQLSPFSSDGGDSFAETAPQSTPSTPFTATKPAVAVAEAEGLQAEVQQLRTRVETLEQTVDELRDSLDDLKRSLGV